MNDIFTLIGKIIAAVGGAGVIIIALTGFLSKLWAQWFMENQQKKYAEELEHIKGDLNKEIEKLRAFNEVAIKKDNILFESELSSISEILPTVMKMCQIPQNIIVYADVRFSYNRNLTMEEAANYEALIVEKIHELLSLYTILEDYLFNNICIGFMNKEIVESIEQLFSYCYRFSAEVTLMDLDDKEKFNEVISPIYNDIYNAKLIVVEKLRNYFEEVKRI